MGDKDEQGYKLIGFPNSNGNYLTDCGMIVVNAYSKHLDEPGSSHLPHPVDSYLPIVILVMNNNGLGVRDIMFKKEMLNIVPMVMGLRILGIMLH